MSADSHVLGRMTLHRGIEERLEAAGILARDAEGIQHFGGGLANVRVTRGNSAEFGWECEVTIGGVRDGRRRLADWYIAAEIASDSNTIVRLRVWRAADVRSYMTGGDSSDKGLVALRATTEGGHGIRLNLRDPRIQSLAADLTPLLPRRTV